MKGIAARYVAIALGLGLSSCAASAQTNLPGVTVTAPLYSSRHGGYLISGDFKVDPRMPYVAFPAQALVKDDILSVEPVHLADDDYLVVQECEVADCSQARLVRVWNAIGAQTPTQNSENRIWIRHENKYFIWVKQLPYVSPMMASDCLSDRDCPSHFTTFVPVSPPLTLIATGQLSAIYARQLAQAGNEVPRKVVRQEHEGSTFVVTYEGGSTIRIRRMHAAR
ncbi:MAG TPA: hypothetical protein VGC19_09415 [Rhodanobacter sp.]